MPDLSEIFKNCVKNVAENIIKNRAATENTSSSDQKINVGPGQDIEVSQEKEEKEEKERRKYSDPFVDTHMKMIEEYAEKINMVSKKLFEEFLKKIIEQFNNESPTEKISIKLPQAQGAQATQERSQNNSNLSAPKPSVATDNPEAKKEQSMPNANAATQPRKMSPPSSTSTMESSASEVASIKVETKPPSAPELEKVDVANNVEEISKLVK